MTAGMHHSQNDKTIEKTKFVVDTLEILEE